MMSGRSSKTPLSSISRVGSLEERWFLTHIMDVGYVQEMSCIRFQASLMSGGSSNTLSEYRLCPGDVMFQILGL